MAKRAQNAEQAANESQIAATEEAWEAGTNKKGAARKAAAVDKAAEKARLKKERDDLLAAEED